MRRPLPAAFALALASLAGSPAGTALATPAYGLVANSACTTPEPDVTLGELYVLKIPGSPTGRSTDWIWNVEAKGEGRSDDQAFLDDPPGTWSIGDVWAQPQTPTDAAFAFVTLGADRLYVDGSDGSIVSWEVAPPQVVGNSLPVGTDAGIGLELPSTPGTYEVQMAPGIVRTFPMATTSGALVMAFGTIAEVNPREAVPGSCSIGGTAYNPQDPTRGAIIGYNVFRLPQCTCRPTPDDFHAAMMTPDDADGGWIAFMDLRKFNVTIPDGSSPGPGLPSPNDLDPLDGVGLRNPDGVMYTGDEVLLFTDSDVIPRPRAGELAPIRGINYWYAFQPVVWGKVSDFASVDFTSNSVHPGDHRVDADGNGEFDGVSLNTVAPAHDTLEFYSPQAEPRNGGQDGLGLTFHGRAMLSGCTEVLWTLLPARRPVSLTGSAGERGVALTLEAGLEDSDVVGYDVYRVAGASRVRVNEEPILAIGTEGATYELSDQSLRARRPTGAQYVVVTTTTDGTQHEDGPFTVSAPPPRRGR